MIEDFLNNSIERAKGMTFQVFGLEWWEPDVFGFWFIGIETTNFHRSLLGVHYWAGELTFDICYIPFKFFI